MTHPTPTSVPPADGRPGANPPGARPAPKRSAARKAADKRYFSKPEVKARRKELDRLRWLNASEERKARSRERARLYAAQKRAERRAQGLPATTRPKVPNRTSPAYRYRRKLLRAGLPIEAVNEAVARFTS